MFIDVVPSIHKHVQRPDVLVQLGYIWRHVSAVNRPSSGQHRTILLRYRLYLNNIIKVQAVP